jgi:Tol biopolymer transport system component
MDQGHNNFIATIGCRERNSEVTTQATTQTIGTEGKSKRVVLASLALGAALGALVALAGTAQQAEAALADKIVFTSNRMGSAGVDNPTGDYEIFRMNPDGTGLKQLTFNEGDDHEPILSPDGTKIAYRYKSFRDADSQGRGEIYRLNSLDGSSKKNLTNNSDIGDYGPVFSPHG